MRGRLRCKQALQLHSSVPFHIHNMLGPSICNLGGAPGEEKKNKKQMLAFLTSIELEMEGFAMSP